MPNHLIKEPSPYLRQHADNPVDWYPWGPEAFERAQRENKPIFLSIGYSTCHWCHVMAHESFEHPNVARLMNEAFVSIKVDREERPDIDNIYMSACQVMTGSGGWPLSIIMTPDKRPFYAATYIPRESRFGLIGMLELIPRIRELWTTQRGEALGLANKVASVLQQASQDTASEELDEMALDLTYEQLAQRFDGQHGGFGSAPKFPTAHNLLFLLRFWKRSGNKTALDMAQKTLDAMRHGGIYDQLGFGFHRYSTDSQWLVPHFEKMVYDQAMLAMAYTEAYQATGKEDYGRTAREILTYVLRDMTAPEGGFYSAEDADSEGEEGKFYLWTQEQIRQALGNEELGFVAEVFNIEEGGNFVDQATGRRSGVSILYVTKSLKELASDLSLSQQDLQKHLEVIQQKLFAHREKRVHPMKDDKILTDWNGLMIAALAKGAQAFNEPPYAQAARRAADFVLGTMRKPSGRLWHRHRAGQTGIEANLDDYAFLVWGLIELYEAIFDARYLKVALELTDDMLRHFWDEDGGGLYLMPEDGESLLVRKKEIYDGAIPSGNSVAMLNLLRLGRMTAKSNLEEKAAKIGRAFSRSAQQLPSAHTQLMIALDFGIGPCYEVVIAGNAQAEDTKAMVGALRTRFLPNKVVLLNPEEQKPPEIAQFAEFTRSQSTTEGKATAYVCLNHHCKLPTTDIDKMLELLNVR
ncbi:MAG: thioredoxin domain-containing protein [Dehalococcoidia bacterium]|nr:thioredoxin domain-containing protein [Dehalococcoidia bacterium]MDH4367070.1 thioredoxin domain-containing protein [Dehalococcoidia bacterium]